MIAVLFAIHVVAAEPTATTTATTAATTTATMAVMPFRVQDLAVNEAQKLNKLLSTRAAEHHYEVQSEGTTNQLVDATKSLGLECDPSELACSVKIGRIADVQFLVVGQAVGNLNGGIGIDAHLIDVTAGTELKRATLLLPGNPDAEKIALGVFGEVLFGTESTVTLTPELSPAGAELLVDGVLRAAVAGAPVEGLAPGNHWVVVRKKGFLPYQAALAMKIGESAKLQVTLASDPDSVRVQATSPVVPLVAAGVGALVVVGGGVAMLVGAGPYSAFQAGTQRVGDVGAESKTQLTQADIDNITAGHVQAEQGKVDWDTWGQSTVIVGGVCVGLGVLVATGGAIWGATLLGAKPDEAHAP